MLHLIGRGISYPLQWAIATSDDFGCVVESSGVNKDIEDVKKEAEEMVRYMMDIRGLEIREMLMAHESHRVKQHGAVVAIVVYLENNPL